MFWRNHEVFPSKQDPIWGKEPLVLKEPWLAGTGSQDTGGGAGRLLPMQFDTLIFQESLGRRPGLCMGSGGALFIAQAVALKGYGPAKLQLATLIGKA